MSSFDNILAVYSGEYMKKKLFGNSRCSAKLVLCQNEMVFLENDSGVKQFSQEECLRHKPLWTITIEEIDNVVLSEFGRGDLIVDVYSVNQQDMSCTIHQSDYRNIGKHLDTMGIKWKTKGFRRGKDTFDSVPKQYQEPPKAKERKDRNEVCRLKGLARKKIILYEDHVLLTFSGGESKIPLDDITKVDFRICTKSQVGYFRLRYPGSDARKKPENDDASIFWDDATLNAPAQDLKNVIEQHIQQKKSKPRSASKTPFSVADEIIKLKSLLDAEVITQEEFDSQKSKLLK